jgi:uncharacterized protein YegJ (DUF2314 family)
MFGFFTKKTSTPPLLPAQPNRLQVAFATTFIHTSLTTNRAGFIGTMLQSEDADQALARCWNSFGSIVLPKSEMIAPTGLSRSIFREGERIIVFIIFPTPRVAGEAHFGAVVLGPCDDPQWSAEACKAVPFRYFVLFRAATGTTVDEWTTSPPVPLGSGPDAEPPFFAEWVLNHAVRSAADTTVTVHSGNDDLAAAISKARSELPAVLQRFIAGELPDAGFTVKVPIKDGESTEHFWLSDTTYADGQFSGVIDADPQSVTTVRRGDRWTASVEDVNDWMYIANQKMHGNYTLRALLPKMPPHEAAKYRAALSDEAD